MVRMTVFSSTPKSKESLAARPAAKLGPAEGRQSAQVLAAQSQVAGSEVAPAPALVCRIDPVVDVRIV